MLIVAFGGPRGRADIRPFLDRVLRGRRVTPERIDEVAHHYELFGGLSPITELTMRQARGLEERLAAAGRALPVYVGMRNWHPLLADTLKEMYAAGLRHLVSFIAAPHHSYSSCQQYRENVADARKELRLAMGGDVDVTHESWFDHPLSIEVNARHVLAALDRLPGRGAARRPGRLYGTRHSAADGGRVAIPRAVAAVRTPRRGKSGRGRLDRGVSEPQRASGGSVARTGRVRVLTPNARKGYLVPTRHAQSCRSDFTYGNVTAATQVDPPPRS